MTSSDETEFVQSQNDDEDNSSDDDNNFEQPSKKVEQPTLKCSKCKLDLPLTDFYETTNYWHEKRGRTYICKTCSRASARASAKKRREQKEVSS